MRSIYTLILLVACLCFASLCRAQQLLPIGLEGLTVRDLALSDSVLYAACESEGVKYYNMRLGPNAKWEDLGLKGEECIALHAKEPGTYQIEELIVGTAFTPLRSAKVFRWTKAKGFEEITSGLPSSQQVTSIDGIPATQLLPAVTFVGGDQLMKRYESDTTWRTTPVFPAQIVHVTKESRTVGVSSFFGEASRHFNVSTDRGESWVSEEVPETLEGQAVSLIMTEPITDPTNHVRVITGFAGFSSGSIGYRVQAGASEAHWESTTLVNQPYLASRMVQDALNPRHVYVFWSNAQYSQFAPAETFDLGQTWQSYSAMEGVSGVTRAIADPTTSGVVYLSTWNSGVLVYTSLGEAAVAVAKPEAMLHASQNPFRSVVTIAGVPKNVERVEIYDAIGRIVQSSVPVTGAIRFSAPTAGAYFVRAGQHTLPIRAQR